MKKTLPILLLAVACGSSVSGLPATAQEAGDFRPGIAVRAGHHCAQPILRHYGLEGTVRPVLAFYNTQEEIDLLADALARLVG